MTAKTYYNPGLVRYVIHSRHLHLDMTLYLSSQLPLSSALSYIAMHDMINYCSILPILFKLTCFTALNVHILFCNYFTVYTGLYGRYNGYITEIN